MTNERMLQGRHVIFVGLNFAPEQTGIAPYTSDAAKGLASLGARVTVITTHPHYPQWRAEPWRETGLTRRVFENGCSVIRLRHYVPRKPVHSRRAVSELTFGLRAVAHIPEDTDVAVLVSPGMFASLVVGMFIRRRRSRVKTVTWVQDIYSAGMSELADTEDKNPLKSRLTVAKTALIRRLERTLLSKSDKVLVIHDRFATYMSEKRMVDSSAISVLRNWTHLDLLQPAAVSPNRRVQTRSSFGWKPDEIIVLHTGNMGVKQDLVNVVSAGIALDAAALQPNIRFVLMGNGSEFARLHAASASSSHVDVIDPVEKELYLDALRAADILLVNEAAGMRDVAVPSKLTSYFASGRAVLAATDEESITAFEVVRSGGGIVVRPGNPHALIEGVVRLSDSPQLLDEMGSAGLSFYKRELQRDGAIHRLGSIISAILPGSP